MLSPPEWNSLILKAEKGDAKPLTTAVRDEAQDLLNPREEWEGSWSTSQLLEKLYPASACGRDFLSRRKRYMFRALTVLARGVMKPYVTTDMTKTIKAFKGAGHPRRWHGPIHGCCPTCHRPYQF